MKKREDVFQDFRWSKATAKPAKKVSKKKLNPPGPFAGFLLGFFMRAVFNFIGELIAMATK